MASLMRRAAIVLVAGLLGGPAWGDRADEREQFRQAWEAAGRGNQAALRAAIDSLPDYPLTPFLEAELKRQRIDRVENAEMSVFLARYRDWSFAPGLERTWLRSLGRRGDFAALVRYGRESSDAEVRCWLVRADIEAGQDDGLNDRVSAMWLVGRSQHEACDPAFAWWRARGYPEAGQGWTRFQMAMESGQTGLARYLRRYLNRAEREWAERWLTLHARPQLLMRQVRQWPDDEVARYLASITLQRLARSDWDQADGYWRLVQRRLEFSEAERASIEREIALFRAVALDVDAPAAIDALPERALDQQMLEWRARAAMAHGNWPEVLESIRRMSLAEQGQGRWRYWRGRALAALDRPEALVAFGSLAGEATYHGFLAASRLGQDFNLCEQELAADPPSQRRLMRDAEFERALELYQVGLISHARRTWSSVWRRLSAEERHQAALLAAGYGWHDRTIAALGASGAMRAYPWRFPIIEKSRVMAYSERWRVDPALVYGLMRAESAMQPDALSPAGARGLLQLMPATAGAVARRNGLPYNGRGDLMDPAVNIPLGIAHLAELQERFDDQWIFVAAAYNAGINAVNRWLDDRPRTDPDVWLETLPFFETRDYVPRVLAFATIYEWQLQRPPQVLATNILPGRTNAAARFQCSE